MATIDDLTFTLLEDGSGYSVKATNSRSISGVLEIPAEYNGLPVTTLNEVAFHLCPLLTSIMIPSSVTKIHYHAVNCENLSSVIVENGNSVYHSDGNCCIRTADSELVFGCKNSIIPNYVTTIGAYAFDQCESLVSITIPESVTKIYALAFSWCTSLTSITIPKSVTLIQDSVFWYCKALEYFKFEGNAIRQASDVFFGTSNLSCVHVNAGTTGWGETWGGKPVVVDGALVNGVKFGDVEISAAYVGDVAISAIYAGKTKIFG